MRCLSTLLTGYFSYALLSTFLLAGLPLLRVARLSSLLLTYILTCGRAYFSNSLLVRSPLCWLLLLHVACPLFFSLAYLSYALLVCPHFCLAALTSQMCCLSALFASLFLIGIACPFSSLAFFLYALLVRLLLFTGQLLYVA